MRTRRIGLAFSSLTAIFLLLILGSQYAAFAFQGTDIRLNTSIPAGVATAQYPKITSDANGHVYVVWQDSRNGRYDIYFNYSSDNGAAWQANDLRINTTPAGTEYAHYPRICCDEHGHVYAVWLDDRGISFNYSSDYGAHWLTDDIRVKEFLPNEALDEPWISCDANGHVYVTWRAACRNGYGLCGSWDIYFNSSSDYGANWQADAIRLDTDIPLAGHSMSPQVNCDLNGHVYVAWSDSRNGGSDIYFNTSSDYGKHWLADDLRLDTDFPGANQSSLPQIASDPNGHVYVAWDDSRSGRFNYSSDYGHTWQLQDIKLSHTQLVDGGSPGINCDENGHVYAAWTDSRNNVEDIFFNHSSDYGVNWQPDDVRVDSGLGASQSPEISCDAQGKVYVVWIENNIYRTDVYFNYSLNYGATWQQPASRLNSDIPKRGDCAWPQIGNDRNGNVYVTWQDNRNGNYDIYFNHSKFDSSENRKPLLGAIGNKTVNAGELLQFTVTASDPDGDTLTYSATNLPPGAAFNPATQVFSWTPNSTQVGSYPGVHFEVTDGKLVDSEDITITVNKPVPSEYMIKWWGDWKGAKPTREKSRTQQATLEAFIAIFGRNPNSQENIGGTFCYKGKLDAAIGIVFQDGRWSWFSNPSLMTATGWFRNGYWDVYCGTISPDDPPTANAGPDQIISTIGTLVGLSGAQSFDPGGDPLKYQWSFISRPAGSTASLSNATAAAPTFTADVHGKYVLQLVVSDLWAQSQPARVTVSFINIKPIARAKVNQSVMVGDKVTLDGSASSDANEDRLTYKWSFVSLPQRSHPAIANPAAAVTTFTADQPGTYAVRLIVNDRFADSDPSTVWIAVIVSRTQAIEAVKLVKTQVASLNPHIFSSPNNSDLQNTLLQKLDTVIINIGAGNDLAALKLLENDILTKTDGCAAAGAPDKSDWIRDCASQRKVYPHLLDAIAQVKSLLQ